MAKKPNGRFLLTWNENKHPEISAFFNEIEEGLYSHTLRQAIKFYMNHKHGDGTKNSPIHSFKGDSGLNNEGVAQYTDQDETSHQASNIDEYDEFNPNKDL